MNRFCKRFFKLFFAAVIALMLLLSCGLANRLHDLCDSRPADGTTLVVEWSYYGNTPMKALRFPG